MPACAAVGCSNRSERGYIMKCFPRNQKLRKIWQERVARADWEPSNNSFLCHVHFEPQQWSITQNGRIRLKRNAVPSIFTIRTTRKSLKKRTKVFHNRDSKYNSGKMDSKGEDFGEKEFALETKPDQCTLSDKNNLQCSHKFLEKGEGISIEKHCPDKDITMMAEDSLADTNSFEKECNLTNQISNEEKNVEKSPCINKMECPQMSSVVVKEEIKLEVMDQNNFEDSYDEIEQKLKQICDGASTEDENCKSKMKEKMMIDEKEINEESKEEDKSKEFIVENNKVTAEESCNISTKNEIGHMLTEKEENVEIIFGTESGDEKISVSQVTSKSNRLDKSIVGYDTICIKDEKKTFNEDLDENFSKDEVHVIPNIRAAMKRKRRTREEIMRSIKKSIRSTSDQDINSSCDSELSDGEIEIKNELSLFSEDAASVNKEDTEGGTAKFIIKITGDLDDVTEIIEDLSPNAIGTQISKTKENETLVTSVITVVSPKNAKEIIQRDFTSPLITDCETPNKRMNVSACDEKDFTSINSAHSSKSCHCLKCVHSNPDDDRQKIENSSAHKNQQCTAQTLMKNDVEYLPSDYEDLLERIQIQEDVIGKLIDQLVIYKELENSLRSKNNIHELPVRETEGHKINTRSSGIQSSILSKKNFESKQRLIEDLSNRVNYFEEMNKKLMKTVAQESQQKRKLEGQIKQKDNRMKELNWKLEKASKYLERAEKNTNTYRRKMLNMQTIMRRRKLLDEKMSKFNEMLIDSSKQEFSDRVLTMAADIRKVCGRNGYDKLLSYGFPLPPLPALRKGILNEDLAESNKTDTNELQNSANLNVKSEKAHNKNNESDVDGKDVEMSGSISKPEYEGSETVTGIVQDIFDENNDGDDFSTNELREHFILQLNAVM